MYKAFAHFFLGFIYILLILCNLQYCFEYINLCDIPLDVLYNKDEPIGKFTFRFARHGTNMKKMMLSQTFRNINIGNNKVVHCPSKKDFLIGQGRLGGRGGSLVLYPR
jgi:hypothetical protein